MRYQGGKARLARFIAAVVQRAADFAGTREVEDRYCGGLAVAAALDARGLRVRAVEDGAPSLIVLYRAIAAGTWDPPARLSAADYAAIAGRADPADPATAFALLFCSYGGMWRAGRAPDDERWPGETARYAAAAARRDLLALRPLLASAEIREGDGLGPCDGAVCYVDFPYQGALGYPAAPPFDPAGAWARLAGLAARGPVLGSEATPPPGEGWEEVWTWRNPRRQLRPKGAVERLYARGELAAHLTSDAGRG